MRTRDWAERGIARLARRRPEVVELARLLSPAVFVEIELLRAMRLALFPRTSPALEADLWFSPIVRARSAAGISLEPMAVEVLREQLATLWREESLQERLRRARSVMEEVHHDLSPALVLEERVSWAVAMLDLPEVERELGRAVRAFDDGGRPGIAAWAAQAWGRLPSLARSTAAGMALHDIARTAFSGSLPLVQNAPASSAGNLADVLSGIRDVKLGVRREGPRLQLGNVGTEGSVAILVPDTNPRLVDVSWVEGDTEQRRSLAVFVGEREALEVGAGPVRLQTARGVVFEVAAAEDSRYGRAFHAQLLITTESDGSLRIVIASAAGQRVSSVDRGQLMHAREVIADLDRGMREESVRKLAELLLPRDLQDSDVVGGDLVLAVDSGSAEWPWELVIGSRVERPSVDAMGIIRRLIMPERPPASPPHHRTAVRALVAVASEEEHRAEGVDRLLTEHGIQVTVVREGARGLLKELFSTEYDILHVIGPGTIADRGPGIMLGREGQVLLTPKEVSQLRTVPALVFLDIHAGPRGEHRTSEGRIVASELAVVLERRGAAALVVNAWPLEDVLSAAFVRRFYGELLSGGHPFLDAVKASRWDVFQRGDRKTPHWAAFQCYGEADYTLSPSTSPPSNR